MIINNKNDIAVDNAVVDHPNDICGVLDKVQTKAINFYLSNNFSLKKKLTKFSTHTTKRGFIIWKASRIKI